MDDRPFKIGNTVQLKSGGPMMTVVNVGKASTGIESVWCKWFNGDGRLENGAFPAESVALID